MATDTDYISYVIPSVVALNIFSHKACQTYYLSSAKEKNIVQQIENGLDVNNA
jgi:hypothetical protein